MKICEGKDLRLLFRIKNYTSVFSGWVLLLLTRNANLLSGFRSTQRAWHGAATRPCKDRGEASVQGLSVGSGGTGGPLCGLCGLCGKIRDG